MVTYENDATTELSPGSPNPVRARPQLGTVQLRRYTTI